MLREIILLALGAVFGLGATMTGAVAPAYLNLSSWALHWLFWGGIALMAAMAIDAACLLLWRPQLMTALYFNIGLLFLAAAAVNQLSPRAAVATARGKAVQISMGNGGPYETVEPAGVNRARTIRVKIENNTDAEISNGKVQVLDLDPPYRGNKDWLLKEGITIGPHKHAFVEVAAYNEGSSQAQPGASIRLIVPMGGGFFAEAYPNLSVEPHTFQLKFSTLEGGLFDEIYCRLFVDSNHVLHLEDGVSSSKQIQIEVPPSAILMPEPDRLKFENHSSYELHLWGDKFADQPTPLEKEPRIIPVGYHYYFLTDKLAEKAKEIVGVSGEDLFPFEVYFSTPSQKHYTAKFGLLIKMTNGTMTVHAQQLGVRDGGW